MQLEIKCPECGKLSKTDWEKVPGGKLRTTCHGCSHRFVLEKEASVNCRAVQEGEAAMNQTGWKVKTPACQGMQYDLASITGLVRSGMIGVETTVCPPGGQKYIQAGKIKQLEKAFDQWRQKNQRAQ